jgi:pilus assembly protein CpaB
LTITPANSEPTTKIILQNIQTLASGQQIQRDANGTPQTVSVVTLLVDPNQAEQLTLAATEGRIQLALRNTLDLTVAQTRGVRTSALMAGASRATAGPSTTVRVAPTTTRNDPAPITVETIRGGERTLSTFRGGQ